MVKLYSLKTCPFCLELKDGLDEEGIQYEERDVEIPQYEKEFDRYAKIADTDSIPMMVIGKQVFAPDVSFRSIEEAVMLAKRFTQS